MSYPSVAEMTDMPPGHGGIDMAFLDAGHWRRRLREVVARRIVPSLAARCRGEGRAMIPQSAVAAFASLLLAAPLSAAVAMVEGQIESGRGFDEVMLLLFAPAARWLGDLWLADKMSFLDVTRGTATLQGLIRHFGPGFEAGAAPVPHGRSILLAPVPGEQHVLGLCMLATTFRRAGWHVVFEPRADAGAILERVAAEPFDMVGLSASCTRFADRLPGFAAEIRASSGRRRLPVIAGGALVAERRAAGADLGTDGVAGTADDAVALADRLAPAACRPA